MHRFRRLAPLALALALVAGACAPGFQAKTFRGTNEQLFAAALAEYQKKRWESAAAAFERLTLELPARDTLLPRAHLYLARSHMGRKQYLLAAQAFGRMAESFPNDSLADDAMFEAANAYKRLWRRPDLDAQYGTAALTTYGTLMAVYPDSPLRAASDREIARLQQWFASKDYENGMHYFRRKAFDSAIIYFKGVLETYGTTPRARDAALRLVESYRAIRYREDADELCATLRERYAGDREVREECGAAPVSATARPPGATP
jgi:outer membrane protein assembly factor BamD